MDQGLEKRLRAVEDRLAIYQVVCGYGYAVDGCNAAAVADCYTEDGVYAVGDVGAFEGRDAVAAITTSARHRGMVATGCAHVSTLPYVVVDGDRAVATCHTMVPMHGAQGYFISRLSASRIELVREADGRWRIAHRQNFVQDGSADGPALLARLQEGPRA